MDNKGGFWKIFILVVIVLAFAIGIAAYKVNSMVGEQLRIIMTPEYKESKAIGTEPANFEVDIKLYNKFVCEASCSYTLTDISHNILIDKGYFAVKGFKNEHYSKGLPMDFYGYGTNLYMYRLECQSNQTPLCPATKDIIFRKSLLVLSYEPSEEQISAKQFLDSNYPVIKNDTDYAEFNVEYANSILENVSFVFSKGQFDALSDQVSSLDSDMSTVMDLWINDNYVGAMSLMDGSDMLERSNSTRVGSEQYVSYLTQTIQTHNTVVDAINENHDILDSYRKILSFSDDITGFNDTQKGSILNFILRSNILIDSVNSQNYSSQIITSELMSLSIAMPKINQMISSKSHDSLVDAYAPLYIYSNLACKIDSKNSSLCIKELSQNSDLQNYVFAKGNSSNSSCNSTANDTCFIDDPKDLANRYYDLCTLSKTMMSNPDEHGKPDSNDTQVSDQMKNAMLYEYKFLLDYSSKAETDGAKSAKLVSYRSDLEYSLKNDFNVSDPRKAIENKTFQSSELSLYQDDIFFFAIRSLNIDCNAGSEIYVPDLAALTSTKKVLPDQPNRTQAQIELPATVSKCCVYDMCQSCEKHNDKDPLIFMHGHSFNQDIDAYRAIEIFDGMEYEFSGDNLYFLSGMLVPAQNETPGILGNFVVPVISKPTYYLETYNDLLGINVKESKDANIDTYALRLKDSIDHTLYLTGSDKVDIVAHSMGGLVVRRYIQIFGTEKIDTVILVGTPNNGVNDKTYNLCKLFGSSAECEDMHEGSLFLRKLNDKSQQNYSNMYLVVGRGCETEGVDGDGVVTVESAVIDGFPSDHIFYVDRGSEGCSVTNVFHQDLIRTNKYPQVYEFIKERLGHADGRSSNDTDN